MDENLELLEYIYQTADMGTKSLNNLLNDIKDKDNKIKKIVSEQLKGYEKYLKEAKELLKKHDTKPKGKGIMADIMSKMGIKKEIKEDNSDAAIADMLVQGFTLGNLEMQKRIDNFANKADKKIIALANNLLQFGENSIKDLKPYL